MKVIEIKRLILKFKVYIKYLIAGGISFSVDLVLLYFFADIMKYHYLISASLAFMIAFFVSFYLQKFWTFRDNDREKMLGQMFVYLSVALVNLAINAALMFVFVDYFHIWYIFAQVLASGLIAIESFIVYNLFIFNQKAKELPINEQPRQ